MLKQIACLEAYKQLHEVGALTDKLVPRIVMEEALSPECGTENEPYDSEQVKYFPPEIVSNVAYPSSEQLYHGYSVELKKNFEYHIPVQNIMLVMSDKLELDDESMKFDLEVDRGTLTVEINFFGMISLKPEEVLLGRLFQITMFRVLLHHNMGKLKDILDGFHLVGERSNADFVDYLLLPSAPKHLHPSTIDWTCVSSVLFSTENVQDKHMDNCPSNICTRTVHTINGVVCTCMLENSLVHTPHNDRLYHVIGILDELNGNSFLRLKHGVTTTYNEYFSSQHKINLCWQEEPLLRGRNILLVKDFLQKRGYKKDKESSHKTVELPPELCFILMAPISISTFYSFTFLPSIMHRITSLLLAANLNKICTDHCKQNVVIPAIKILEAITTKNCNQKFHLESLETLGDSFLKYATSQQLFKTNQNHSEGLLSDNREKIISNPALCKVANDHKLPGFIQNETFDLRNWSIPGDRTGSYILKEDRLSPIQKVFIVGRRTISLKDVADAVEALIGAFLSTNGEMSALMFMDWLGIKVNFINTPYKRQFTVHPEKMLKLEDLESLLKYPFRDRSLLVEALTHGSYMLPDITRSYQFFFALNYFSLGVQRLEFLGDAVLDYLITAHLYLEFPGMSPELLTDLRSAQVNNDCYAQSAIKAGLHDYILHASPVLRKDIAVAVNEFMKFSTESTFGWESDAYFPKVLGDVLESLAGAILVDSGYDKDIVFRSMRPLLEPLITPDTLRLHPVKELHELCQKEHFVRKKPVVTSENAIRSKIMERVQMGTMPENQRQPADPLPFARSYQVEALEKAINENTIVFLETGSGKTLIAIMLLRSYAYLLRKPSPFIAVFLVPTVVLVTQQAEAVKLHTDLKVGKYWGEMGVDFWDANIWKQEQDKYEVLVMTHDILLRSLRCSYLKLDFIKVLIFDECHNARGRHAYACIMSEFYHPQLRANKPELPRIFGMTASPVKAKGSSSAVGYWKQISELENLMHSKVYTCVSDSVLARYIPSANTKIRTYEHKEIPYCLFDSLSKAMKCLKIRYKNSLKEMDVNSSSVDSVGRKLSRLYSNFIFCLTELGVWLALKAAESCASNAPIIFSWVKMDVSGEQALKDYSISVSKILLDHIPSGLGWSVGDDITADMEAGFLTSKVVCLIESLLEYRDLRDLRCIIFVQRVMTAIALQALLCEILPKLTVWKSEYIAGHTSRVQSQSRSLQNKIVDKFREGAVNIIVATSILEEGLDVQSCNLVIRFDPSATVCSFIQSRGRARMQNSDFVLMVRSGDPVQLKQVENYLNSGKIMREESLRHSSLPCEPFTSEMCNEDYYRVESTGAIVTLSSSVGLLYFYCSRLPSDGYFKPTPRLHIDKEMGICTLHLPKDSLVQKVCVQSNSKMLKQIACLEACKQLHKVGALTDNLVPRIVMEEVLSPECGTENEPYDSEQVKYFPPELVSNFAYPSSEQLYHGYSVELKKNFEYHIPVQNIMLVMSDKLELDDESMKFDLEVDDGALTVEINFFGMISLKPEEVLLGRLFQITMFRVLLHHNLDKLKDILVGLHLVGDPGNADFVDYLLLPSAPKHLHRSIIDWTCVSSVLFSTENVQYKHMNNCPSNGCTRTVHTINGLVCSCMLEDCLVHTPHNDRLYHIIGILDELNGNSPLRLNDGVITTYNEYFSSQYKINLCCQEEPLLRGRNILPVKDFLQRRGHKKDKESSHKTVELPPELCFILMAPISISTFYSFTFLPSIMHRITSLLVAANLKKICTDHCKQNVVIPAIKILEAITTKNCNQKFHLESLETLGDSFLKYAASQQLFKTYQNHHEGLLSVSREKIISNLALCKVAYDHKLPGFIQNETFDLRNWSIPGDRTASYILKEYHLSPIRKIFIVGRRTMKLKHVADAVEALIGAFLSTNGEIGALVFMDWLGIKVNFINTPYKRQFSVHPEKMLNLEYLESLLKYSFRDHSLLVEALTHGSYMLPDIPRCYQRLEFLGDAVLDYLITAHLYLEFPGMSPGLMTDLRSAQVNNDCYAQSSIKAGLHKHILHASPELHKDIAVSVNEFMELSTESTFGWESDAYFPKVLGDVLESLAGAILVDSGYDKDTVFRSMRPLLEPLITPDTLRLNPIRELHDLCQKEHYVRKKPVVTSENGMTSLELVVEANGVVYGHKCSARDKKTAEKVASRAILKSLRESIRGNVMQEP
ncbi:Helicase, C-terminal [Dillenia turbinata]|uniref:Helicase, C-terminal n=1 Tax=Dillenia turbinata TaxID=194707 RepID=A0AAN8YUM8_9MAGN